jgi:short-subunit dehydrogenase
MDERKVVVITGASAGIGAALAARLATAGHRLVLAARREPELRQVAGATGGVAVVADVRRRADVERLRDEALAAFGQVDVWVNNAGRGIAVPVLELTDEHVDEMIAVNVKSALYGMQAIVPHFQARGRGHLINVSSFLGRVPYVSLRSIYSASKAALNSLTANLRMDLAAQHPDIHVTVVMPGVVRTEFARNALAAKPGAPVPPVSQSAEEVAEVIAGVIADPKPEVYTQPAQPETARRYFADVAAFEAGLRR